MVRLLIAGPRDYTDYAFFQEKVDFFTASFGEDVTLINGKCKTGVDQMAVMYAQERGWKIEFYEAEWDLHGKAAGPIRNTEMAKEATHFIGFSNGSSRGTEDMIRKAQQHKLISRIIKI